MLELLYKTFHVLITKYIDLIDKSRTVQIKDIAVT